MRRGRPCETQWQGFSNESNYKCHACRAGGVATDGKALRRARDAGEQGPVIVGAWGAQAGISLGQIKVDEKIGEITAVPAPTRVPGEVRRCWACGDLGEWLPEHLDSFGEWEGLESIEEVACERTVDCEMKVFRCQKSSDRLREPAPVSEARRSRGDRLLQPTPAPLGAGAELN